MAELATNSMTRPAERRRGLPGDRRLWLLLISIAIIALDRWTKWMVASHIALGGGIVVIPHIFAISHVENTGAAFSLFDSVSSTDRVRWMLFGFSIVAALVVLWLLLKLGRKMGPTSVGLALILAGALGNAYDRLQFGYVVDFLAVQIVHYHWPDFNVADSAIVIGGLLLLYDALLRPA